MLARHILGYIPSLVVPGLASFAAVYCYTRLLEPGAYGHYALAINSMALLNAVFFYWLQIALPRLMPQAVREGRAGQLRATVYIAFAATSIVLIACAAVVIGLAPLGDLKQVAWLAVPLALARALLNMNQAFHRSALDFRSYNIIECGQAVIGLATGLALVYWLRMDNVGAVVGMLLGMGCMMLVDVRALLRTSSKDFSRQALTEIMRFGLPLVLTYALAFTVSTSDRFIIEHYHGAAQVGIYAAGFSLIDRITQILFMMIATPSFPLTIHKLEHDGIEAARAQTYANGVAMLAVALPACAGLILCDRQLAAVLIGPDFRIGAMQVMPWIAVSSVLNGLSAHYFDHAFHLAKKPYLLAFTQGPAAAASVLFNLTLIPRYGYMGAAYAAVASYLLLITLSITLGRRVFAIRFPFKPAFQIACSVALMAAALGPVAFPDTVLGLASMMAMGGAVYGFGLIAFNVMDIRSQVLRVFA